MANAFTRKELMSPLSILKDDDQIDIALEHIRKRELEKRIDTISQKIRTIISENNGPKAKLGTVALRAINEQSGTINYLIEEKDNAGITKRPYDQCIQMIIWKQQDQLKLLEKLLRALRIKS
jgi:hypothetical protein